MVPLRLFSRVFQMASWAVNDERSQHDLPIWIVCCPTAAVVVVIEVIKSTSFVKYERKKMILLSSLYPYICVQYILICIYFIRVIDSERCCCVDHLVLSPAKKWRKKSHCVEQNSTYTGGFCVLLSPVQGEKLYRYDATFVNPWFRYFDVHRDVLIRSSWFYMFLCQAVHRRTP